MAGNRTERIRGAVHEQYLYDECNRLLQITDGADTVKNYTYDNSGNMLSDGKCFISMTVSEGWNRKKSGYHYYHLDEQNSTAYITGSSGEIENRYEYNAFGVLKNSREEFHNRILYTGQQYDQTSGQYYLRARFYNPVIGRFVQEDEYRGDGLNLYAYCKNNPVVYL